MKTLPIHCLPLVAILHCIYRTKQIEFLVFSNHIERLYLSPVQSSVDQSQTPYCFEVHYTFRLLQFLILLKSLCNSSYFPTLLLYSQSDSSCNMKTVLVKLAPG